MCSSRRRGPRPKSVAGNLPSKLSSPFLFSFHESSTSQAQTLSHSVVPNPSFALLAQFTTVPLRAIQPGGIQLETSGARSAARLGRHTHPAAQAGGPLTDLLLCQAQLHEAKSPNCVPPKLVHGVRDETKGSSRLWKRVAGRGVTRVNGTCHWLGAAGQ